MANVSVSSIANDINVSSTLSNISVSDDSGQFLVNVTSTASAITVNPVNTVVEVAASAIVSNQAIRAAIEVANVSGFGNISYDSNIDTSDGIISYVGVSSSDIRSQLSANTSNGITYDDATGIIDQNLNTDLVSEGVSNLYYTNARFDFNFSQKDTDDLSEGTTNLYLNGAGTTDDLAEGSANLWFTNARAVSAITDATIAPGNVTLKEFKETIVDNGAATSGALTLDMSLGSLHLVAIDGDITGITLSNMDEGATATIVFEQDAFGGRTIDTSSGFGAWNFMGGITDLGPIGGSRSVLVVTLADSVYNASISSPDAATTDDLSEGGTNLYYTDARSRSALSVTTGTPSGDGALSYNSGTGVFSFTPADTGEGLTNAQAQAYIETNGLNGTGDITMTGIATFGQNATDTHSFTGNLDVTGNLEVSGNLNYREVEDLLVQDQTITLNYGNASAQDAQIIVDRSGSTLTNVDIKWNETTDKWTFSNDGATYYNIGAVESVNTQTGVVVLDTGDIPQEAGANATVGNAYFTRSEFRNESDIYFDRTNTIPASPTIQYTTGTLTLRDTAVTPKTYGDATNIPQLTVDQQGRITGVSNVAISIPAANVISVNGQTGVVVLDTDDIAEGSANLYYTDARFDTRFATKTTSDLTEGANLYYTDSRSRAAVSVTTATPSGDGSLSYDNGTGVFTFTPADAGASDYGDSNVVSLLSAFGSNTITTTGNISAGYFIGDGSLLTNISGANVSTVDESRTVVKTVIAGEDLLKGDAVYISGGTGDNPEVSKADADDAAKMPVFGVTTEAVTATNTTDLVIYGLLTSYNTTGFATGESLFVSTTPGELTTTKPTGESALLQTVGKVIKGNSNGGKITITGAGRTNATPNLNDGNIFIGNGSNQSVSAVLDTSIVPENTNLYFSNTRVDSYLQDGEATVIRTSVDAQPIALAENGFIARQSSGSSGDSANVYSVPRISTYKAGANTDWTAGTIVESEANIDISAINHDSARYRKFVIGGGVTAEGVTNLPATAIVSSQNAKNDINASWFGGYITSDSVFSQGTIEFRTAQESVANTLISQNDYIYYSNLTSTEDATVAYMDTQFHVGTKSSSYSFPKTPGTTDQILQLDSNGDLQFVTKPGIDATGTVTSIDISTGTNLTPSGGPITTSGTINIDMSNALTQMNSITAVTDFDLNVDRNFDITGNFGAAGDDTDMAKITSDGYAVYAGNQYTSSVRGSYTDTANITFYKIEGNIVAGSDTITVTNIKNPVTDVATNVSVVNNGMIVSDYFDAAAYVTGTDVGNSTITFNETAIESADVTYTDDVFMRNALVDTATGLVVTVQSELESSGTGNLNTLGRVFPLNISYGYPQTGFTNADFDIYSVGNSSVFSFVDDTAFTIARSSVTAANTALKVPTGIIVGRNGDLSNRGEADPNPAFGITQMWDGIEPVSSTVQPHILAKSYAQNTQLNFDVTKGAGATRLFFTTADGSINSNPYDTYPRINQELGRIAWWGSTGTHLTPSSYNVPAFISVGAADNWDTWGGQAAGNTNVYMGATSDGLNPDTYLAYKGGELFLGGGNSKPVTFAPAFNGTGQTPQSAYAGTPGAWANVNYANVSASSGGKLSITNSGRAGAGSVGDQEMGVLRIDNTALTTFAIQDILSNIYLGGDGSAPVMRVPSGPGDISGEAVTFNNLIASSASGNESALRNQVKYLEYLSTSGGLDYFKMYEDAALTTITSYTVLGGSNGFNFASQTAAGGAFDAGVQGGVTAREYKFNLAEQSENFVLQSVNSSTPTTSDIITISSLDTSTISEEYQIVMESPVEHSANILTIQSDTTSIDFVGDVNYMQYDIATAPAQTYSFNPVNLKVAANGRGHDGSGTGGVYYLGIRNLSGNAQTIATANTDNTVSYSVASGDNTLLKLTHINQLIFGKQEI